MKTFKVTYFFPDGRQLAQRIKYGESPDLGAIVELPNAQGNMEKYKITGIRTWRKECLLWVIYPVEIYLNNTPM